MKRNIFRAAQPTVSLSQQLVPQSIIALCVALLLIVLASPLSAGVPLVQQEEAIVPPPPRTFTDAEKAQLAAVANDRSKRLRLSLELAESRLARAEQLTGGQQYAAASIELGAYEALIEDAFAFIHEQGRVTNKLRDIFKRFEQALRAHTLRIEAVRRITPITYAAHIATTIKLAKNMRTKTLDAFFGEGSMRNDLSPSEERLGDEPRAATSAPPHDE